MSTAPADVAIVGMAALFPRAPDAQTLWQNVCAKVDAISDPLDWPEEFVCDPASSSNDRVYTRRGGYLGDLVRFDPTAFGVMPRAVDGGEPEHFVALRLAHEALADAGYADRPFPRDRTAVILGRGTYVNRGMIAALQHGIVVDQTIRLLATLVPDRTPEELERLRRLLKAQLPPFNSETAQSLAHSAMCGRIANRLDLMGPAYTVDAACASSLIAVGQAAQALRDGTCDVALAGGIQISTSFPIAVLFCQLGALSRSGQLRPFHPEADGTLLGEGAGVLVLKRLADAIRDEDRIYAVVKGVGIASDGRAMGVLTPRVEGEELALRRAYAAADISPDTIGLVEAHGTGTVAGDATELEALRRVFAPRERGPRCALGSIKSMIGHSIPAAGSAGLVKAALALHYRVLPPTLYAEEQPPKLAGGPFYLNGEMRPWVHGAEAPRRAGVSAFGFGGINAHVILEEWEPPAPAPRARPVPAMPGPRDSELVVVWGTSRAELVARVVALRDVVSREDRPSLADVAAGLAAEFDADAPWRLAVVATTTADLAAKIRHAAERLADDRCARIKDRSGIFFFAEPLARDGGLAFLFPGEGAQHANMLRELAVHFPAVREAFDRMDRAARLRGERVVPSEGVFPAPGDEDAARRLWEMDGAVEAVFAADQALAALLARLGVVPQAIVGHSSGEYAALLAAGAVRLDAEADLLEKMHAMSRLGGAAAARGLVIEAPLLAVSPTSPEQVPDLLARADGTVHLAMDNCPHQVVLAGTEDAIATAHAELRAAGAMCQRLPFARGYHTPLFARFRDEMRPFFDAIEFVAPAIPLWSCVTAAPMPAEGAEIRRLALEQWAHRVRFRETIEAMHAAGVRVFVEVGPRANLTAFVDDTLKQRPHAAVATNVERRSALLQFHHAVALMVAHGVRVRLAAFHEERRLSPAPVASLFGAVPAAPAASRSMRLPMALPVLRAGAAERDAFGAARPVAEPMPAPPTSLPVVEPTGIPVARGAADALMSEYLRTMEDFLTTQEDVMRAFLGGGAPRAAVAAPQEPPVPAVGGNGHAASPVVPPPSPPPAPAPAAAVALDADGLRALLVRLVSDRTGYPPDMIDPSASLEADLGIDSIKRVEILGALDAETGLVGQDMEGITGLRTLDQLVAHLAARAAGRGPAREPSAPPPLAARVVDRQGDTITMRATLSLARERFLLEHPLGGRVADDPDLRALPVCPLAMTLELLAESAAVALGGGRPIGLRGVRAQRWLAFASPEVALELTVRRIDAERAHVVVRRLVSDDAAEPDPPVVEATVLLAERFPAPPPARPLALESPCAARWAPEQLYDPTQVHGMFHGPAFQGVASLDGIGANGAEATLRVPSAGALIAACPAPAFALDPIVLDAAGQVLGFWNAQQLDPGVLVFPVAVDAIDVLGDSLASAAEARCRVHVRRVEPHRIVADIDVLGPGDRPHLRVTGWEVKRFALPERFYAFRLNPRDVMLSRPVPELSDGERACVAFEVPEGFLESDGGIWRDAMAFLVLGPAEREAWRTLAGSDARRRDWLMGRIAVKDAVRDWLRRRGMVVRAADVEVVVGPEGRPEVRGPWAGRVHVSVSHSDGVAVGIASAGGVGVDVERVGRTRADFERAAFTPAERAILDALPAARDEWALRMWCAKEAAVKALGRGFVNGPGDAVASAVDPASGVVDVAPAGALAAHGSIRARTERVGDIVFAVAEIATDARGAGADAAPAAD